jgi:DNA-binding NarL/FixJ family response regulator
MDDASLNKKILLIDDQAMVRDGLRNLFVSHGGLQVIGETENVSEGVALSVKLKPDIVILGISRFETSITAAIKKITEGLPDTRVIVIIREQRRKFLEEILTSGASAYLVGESSFEELSWAVKAVIRGNSYISPNIAEIVIDRFIGKQSENSSKAKAITKREAEVLKCICEGLSTREIAQRLKVSVKTVETHRRRIMEKLKISNMAELIKYAIREGITGI